MKVYFTFIVNVKIGNMKLYEFTFVKMSVYGNSRSSFRKLLTSNLTDTNTVYDTHLRNTLNVPHCSRNMLLYYGCL
jgi:hypothetical protein